MRRKGNRRRKQAKEKDGVIITRIIINRLKGLKAVRKIKGGKLRKKSDLERMERKSG